MNESTENYLHDAFAELLIRAREARDESRRLQAKGANEDAAFHTGRALAYYEVVSYLVGQLDAFGIDRATVGVSAAFDAERDLL